MLGGLLGSNDPPPAAIKTFVAMNSVFSEVTTFQFWISFFESI
jgi:hypothetical protein